MYWPQKNLERLPRGHSQHTRIAGFLYGPAHKVADLQGGVQNTPLTSIFTLKKTRNARATTVIYQWAPEIKCRQPEMQTGRHRC